MSHKQVQVSRREFVRTTVGTGAVFAAPLILARQRKAQANASRLG